MDVLCALKVTGAFDLDICAQWKRLNANAGTDLFVVRINRAWAIDDTVKLTGLGSGKNLPYTSFTAAKSPMSARKMLTFTALARLEPPASRTALRFLRTCSWMWVSELVLESCSVLETHCSGLHIALYQLSSRGVGADLTRAVYHVSNNEALVEDRDRLGRLVGEDDLLAERHFDYDPFAVRFLRSELDMM